MKPFRTPFVPNQRECEPLKKPNTSFAGSSQPPMEVARIRALHHIRDAADVITNAMPHVDSVDRQLYASIVSGLCTLERHLAELKQS
jgi:hypothetical protein